MKVFLIYHDVVYFLENLNENVSIDMHFNCIFVLSQIYTTFMVFVVGIPAGSELVIFNTSYTTGLIYQRRLSRIIKKFLYWFFILILVYGMIILGMIWTRPDIGDGYLGGTFVLIIILAVVYFIFSSGKAIVDFVQGLARYRISAGI